MERKLMSELLKWKDKIGMLELYLNMKISATDTLLFFDEVQEVPRALTSLKYFCEDAPEYYTVR